MTPPDSPPVTRSKWRQAYDRFLRISGDPHDIALGFALGIIVGFTPFEGVQMVIAIAVAAFFRCNKVSAAMAVWVTNPVTVPIIYALTYVVGDWCIGGNAHAAVIQKLHTMDPASWVSAVPDILWPLIIGGVLVSIPIAAIGYFAAYKCITFYRNSRKSHAVLP